MKCLSVSNEKVQVLYSSIRFLRNVWKRRGNYQLFSLLTQATSFCQIDNHQYRSLMIGIRADALAPNIFLRGIKYCVQIFLCCNHSLRKTSANLFLNLIQASRKVLKKSELRSQITNIYDYITLYFSERQQICVFCK